MSPNQSHEVYIIITDQPNSLINVYLFQADVFSEEQLEGMLKEATENVQLK